MPETHKIQSRRVFFQGFEGNRLAASLDFPQQVPPRQYVIACHCFTCTRQTLTIARLSRGLAQAGMAVLRFDFSGLGESEGDFSRTHFRSMLADIEGAARFLAEHHQPARVLVGHSMGGTACLAASQNGLAALNSLQSLVTLASPARPAHILHHFGPAMPALRRGENAEISVAGQAYPVTPGFVADVESYDMDRQMRGCDLPILAITAEKDELVAPQAAQDMIAFSRGKSRIYQIEGADHLFSQRHHAEQLLQAVLEWIF